MSRLDNRPTWKVEAQRDDDKYAREQADEVVTTSSWPPSQEHTVSEVKQHTDTY
jgi:hypothetical protein